MNARPEVFHRLRGQIDKTLLDLIRGVENPALLEFPSYPNVGDSAIWAGEIAFLADRLHQLPTYTGAVENYATSRLAALGSPDVILLSGGGNLGDLWPGYLDAKIRVLSDFRDVPVIQLPQTIHFQDPARFEDYRRAVGRHPRFTLLVRDQAGYEMASAKLDCEVRLCPDMALWLDLQRLGRPQHDVVCLLRTDIEARGPQHRQEAARHGELPVFDWLHEPAGPAIRAERALSRAMGLYPRRLSRLESTLTRLRNRVARQRVRRGCALLSSGKVVLTDRLHAHLLCVLMGIPHVVLDNSYGKVSRFHQSWTRDCPGVRFAQSLSEAVETARSLVTSLG